MCIHRVGLYVSMKLQILYFGKLHFWEMDKLRKINDNKHRNKISGIVALKN